MFAIQAILPNAILTGQWKNPLQTGKLNFIQNLILNQDFEVDVSSRPFAYFPEQRESIKELRNNESVQNGKFRGIVYKGLKQIIHFRKWVFRNISYIPSHSEISRTSVITG